MWCSTGWCVGPSSPTPIESCVHTQATCAAPSAPRGARRAACSRRRSGTSSRRAAASPGRARSRSRSSPSRARGSRTAMLRPAWVAEKTPAPSNSVFVDSTRSAAPPTIVGVNGFSACITVLPASRVATSSPAGNTGSASSQPSRGSPRRSSSRSRASVGNAAAQAARRSSHSRCSSAPRSRDDGHVLAHRVGDGERRVGIEAQRLLRRAHLGLAERRAVRLRRCRPRSAPGRRCACGGRSATAAPPRPAPRRARRASASRSSASSTCWTCQPYASKRLPLSSVVKVSDGRAVDRDVVVVVDVDEPAEPEVAGDRRGLLARRPPSGRRRSRSRRSSESTISWCGPVVALGEEALGDRHADAVREALPERAGRRLDPRACARAPDGPASASPTGGTASGRRARGRSPRGGAPRTGGCRRGRRRGRSGRGRASAGRPGCAASRRGRGGRRRGASAIAVPGMAGVRLLHRVHRERADRVDRQAGGSTRPTCTAKTSACDHSWRLSGPASPTVEQTTYAADRGVARRARSSFGSANVAVQVEPRRTDSEATISTRPSPFGIRRR